MTSTSSIATSAGGLGKSYMARSAILVVGLLACLWGIWISGREGLAQILAGHSALTEQIGEADWAVRLNRAIPEAHYVRASLLYKRDELVEAAKGFERAVALRPRDYALWLQLGRARDQAGDVKGALAAFRESVRLAPFYAQPTWQLGNALLRTGQRDEALAAMQRAAASDPRLFPSAVNLAWRVLDEDPRAVAQALRPSTPSAHLALATFLAGHGKPADAMNHFRAAGDVPKEQRDTLLNELLGSKNFVEAYAVWSSGRQVSQSLASISNGGFEEPIALDEPGFGWQVGNNPPSVRTSLDPAAPHDGSYSLRLDWNGDSDPSTPIISQLVLVEPNRRYRLTLAARTLELASVALPVITVAHPGDQSILAQSEPLPRGASGWQPYSIEFLTTATNTAVQILIRRQKCETAPCAAIGHAWVDSFSLEKL